MQKWIGGAVLAAGVIGLVAWGIQDRAAKSLAALSAGATEIAATAIHSVDVAVDGRIITVSGIADDTGEQDRLIAALEDLDGVADVVNELEVLPTARPYTFAARRSADKTLAQGNVPSEDMRAAIAQSGAEGAERLALASGAPDRWEAAVGAGLAALAQLDEGSVSVTDTAMRLTGLTQTPRDRDALLASLSLPDGFTLDTDIETRDDGKPVDVALRFDAATGFDVNGKLPAGLTQEQIANALGQDDITGETYPSQIGDSLAFHTALKALPDWLPDFETATLGQAQDTVTLEASVAPGGDAEEIQSRLQESLGEDVTVTLAALSPLPAEGTLRTHALTGEEQRFSGGRWGPDIEFTPSLATCSDRTSAVLARGTLSFAGGSTTFETGALDAIDRLAEVMRRCVLEAALIAELGGHTDARGTGNFELSAARAEAVRDALAARGVPAQSISAVGYGPSKPIATNDTEEGRAANRRITVRWGF